MNQKLDEFDSYLLKLAQKVMVLEKKVEILKEELCQANKRAQSSQKEAKPIKTASATKAASKKQSQPLKKQQKQKK